MIGASFPPRRLLALSGLLCLSASVANAAVQSGICENARYENKTRVFVMTDISNEPDDQMSLVRFLTHANELDIVNIAGVTSTWKNDSVDTPSILGVINAYGEVIDNLNSNVPEAGVYPPADELLAKVVVGQPVYGLAALNASTPSNASTALINATDASEEPLWVLAWGGANVLAEALYQVKESRSEDEIADFVRKLRVYSISDQDNAGPWIRTNFPTLFYIVSIHGFSEYSLATWIGISGEGLRPFDSGGPDTSLITNEWLEEHIRIGELGAHYLNWTFIMEGDTPSFLGLLPNGLNAPDHPEWGGWGGRYILADSSGDTTVYSDASDFAIGLNNETFFSKYASIWRWRSAFQYDFAARMQWTVNANASDVNHHPVAVVNGSCGLGALEIEYTFGEDVVLDASESWDPDNDDLTFSWFHYREPTMRLEGEIPRISPNVTFTPVDESGSVVTVTPNNNLTFHILLTVEDARLMNLTAYRRVILKPTA
ncbi:putative cellulose-binding protein [Neofusicoccum parvum UCRNP2]|uniref:Putative cellulose-binding protein n=1 Tax=Botryosphaeria parva (strain UCR-NP2) TaxID=1287680 RepID=R1EF01_BOTPV|nr:putative cellulose-binding protein [Neofusicoccum parvum UCRNP2]